MIFISADDVYRSTMNGPGGVPTMRVTGLDGHDLPSGGGGRGEVPWRFPTGPGHTRDATFTPGSPGDYRLTVERVANSIAGAQTPTGAPTTTVPIRVRSP
jgi:hypothetical protein